PQSLAGVARVPRRTRDRLRRRRPGIAPSPDPGRPGRRLAERDRLGSRPVHAGRSARDDPWRTTRRTRRHHRGMQPGGRELPLRPAADRSRSRRVPDRSRVSAVATTRPRVTVYDRVLAALPLASIYVWLSIIYCVEAWKRATPWLFTDELELTQLSRSIAATGHAARRGEPHSFRSLFVVMTAPIWLIHDVSAAFATIKYVDTLVMTSVLFPTYFLARLVVGRTPALFAATGAAVIPSLAYSSWIVEETFAYPYAAFCFFMIAKALVVRSRGWIVGA